MQYKLYMWAWTSDIADRNKPTVKVRYSNVFYSLNHPHADENENSFPTMLTCIQPTVEGEGLLGSDPGLHFFSSEIYPNFVFTDQFPGWCKYFIMRLIMLVISWRILHLWYHASIPSVRRFEAFWWQSVDIMSAHLYYGMSYLNTSFWVKLG